MVEMYFVFLSIALEGEEIPVAAIELAGKLATGGGTSVIDRAAAFLGIEEPADAAEMLILLAAHDALVGLTEELLLALASGISKCLAMRSASRSFTSMMG